MQQRNRLRRDQRRLLRRLGQHRIAGGERGGDLPGEDRQRKVPRTDADHCPQRRVRNLEFRPRLRGVVAQEVDRLAHFADGVGSDLAGFAHDEADELRHLCVHRIGRPLERKGTRRRAEPMP